MKSVLFFAGVLLLQLTGIQCFDKEAVDACAKELGISEDMLKEGHENHDKPEFHCFHACILKKKGFLEEGKKVNMEKIKESMKKHFGDKAEEMIKAKEECLEEAKDIADECDFVNAVKDCMHKKKPKASNSEDV